MRRFLIALLIAVGAAVGISHAEFIMPAERALHHTTHDKYAQPIGAMITFAGPTCPSGYLEANGATVSRGYSDLYSVMGNASGSGDGSTTFVLPDARGKFMRGWSHASGNDPDAASRTAQATGGNSGDAVGSTQADQFLSHNHSEEGVANNTTCGNGTAKNIPSANSTNTGSTGGNETRPMNSTVIICIFTGVAGVR